MFDTICVFLQQPYKGDPRPCLTLYSAIGLKLGVSGLLRTTSAKTNAIQMRPRSARAVLCFTRVYLHAQTVHVVDAGDICMWWTTVVLIKGKTWRPQYEPHSGIRMAQVLLSPLFGCGFYFVVLIIVFFKIWANTLCLFPIIRLSKITLVNWGHLEKKFYCFLT